MKAGKASGAVVRQKYVSPPSAVDADVGIEERESARHVLRRPERLDEADLGERGGQRRLADLPGDPCRRLHEGAALALLLAAPREAILPEAPAQVRGLPDVEEAAGRIVEAVDAGRSGHLVEEPGAELPVEEPHAPILAGRDAARELFRVTAFAQDHERIRSEPCPSPCDSSAPAIPSAAEGASRPASWWTGRAAASRSTSAPRRSSPWPSRESSTTRSTRSCSRISTAITRPGCRSCSWTRCWRPGARRPITIAGPRDLRARMDAIREALFPGSRVMTPKFPLRLDRDGAGPAPSGARSRW